MAIAPIVPQVNAPQPIELPTHVGQLSQQGFQMKQDIVQSRLTARDDEYQKLQSDWQTKKIKDGDFINRINDLVRTSDSQVERNKFTMRKSQAQDAIFQTKVQVEKDKIDADSYKEGTNPLSVYNRYSGLAKTAAQLGYKELSASLLVSAAQTLNRMKAEQRALAAEGRAAAQDAANAKLQQDMADYQRSLFEPIPSGLAPIPVGPMSTNQGYLIPEPSAEGGFIYVTPEEYQARYGTLPTGQISGPTSPAPPKKKPRVTTGLTR